MRFRWPAGVSAVGGDVGIHWCWGARAYEQRLGSVVTREMGKETEIDRQTDRQRQIDEREESDARG